MDTIYQQPVELWTGYWEGSIPHRTRSTKLYSFHEFEYFDQRETCGKS